MHGGNQMPPRCHHINTDSDFYKGQTVARFRLLQTVSKGHSQLRLRHVCQNDVGDIDGLVTRIKSK
jgi:hypothetical protein